MNRKYLSRALFLFLLSIGISSCFVAKKYARPEVRTDNLFRGGTTDTSSLAALNWRELFTDPILQSLISEGIENNLNLQIALSRVQQAEAAYNQSRAAFQPLIDANAGVTRSRLPETQSFGRSTHITQYQLTTTASWEADIWGRLRSGKRASLANLLQSEAGAQAVQTGLIADIANFYYSLMALDHQAAITEQTVVNWDTTVRTMRALKEAAVVTEAAVVQSEAQRYAAEVTLPDLKQNIRETENALSILLGRAPGAIARSALTEQKTLEVLNTGVSAQLLSNRPDVRAAEFNYRYFFEQTNVARSFFYPSLVISGSAGFSAQSLQNFFDPVNFAASIGAGLAQPIFGRRANRTRLQIARAQQEEASLNFQNTLLQAGGEVSNALSLYQTAVEKMKVRANQIGALQKSVEYSQELLRNGFANYTEVITARQSLLQAELGNVNDRLQQLQAVVTLYRSLGGGWK